MANTNKSKKAKADSRNSNAVSPMESLVRSSSMIFSGTVLEQGISSVPAVSPSNNLITVRLEQGLRISPVLGDLSGKVVTVVAKAPERFSSGQRAVFFTNSWVHGGGIAVREVDHMGIEAAGEVAKVVAQLPEFHLMDRIRSAELIVEAEVGQITAVKERSIERKVALWAAANLDIKKVLLGKPHKSVVVHFPTADWPPWVNAPRFEEKQLGIFILHVPRS
jgi:hypothetical protein